MRTIIQLVLIILGCGTCRNSYALSTITQVTSTNIQNYPFIEIVIVDEGSDHKRFTVKFNTADLDPSEGIEASLEIRVGEQLLALSSVSGTRPTVPSRIQQSAGVKQTPVVFSFIVMQEHLSASKFSVSHVQPDAWRFDDYWFYLRDFTSDKK